MAILLAVPVTMLRAQVYELTVTPVANNVQGYVPISSTRMFAVVPSATSSSEVHVYGLASRTYTYPVYASGGIREETSTEYYVDGKCTHSVKDGQLILPQNPHGSIMYDESYHQHVTLCPVSMFFYGPSAYDGFHTKIQRPDIVLMPLQYNGSYKADAWYTYKTSIQMMPWSSAFMQQLANMGKTMFNAGRYEILVSALSDSVRATSKLLTATIIDKHPDYSAVRNDMVRAAELSMDQFEYRSYAYDLFEEFPEEGSYDQHANLIRQTVLDNAHSMTIYDAVLDAKKLTALALLVKNQPDDRLVSIARNKRNVESRIADVKGAIEKLVQLTRHVAELRSAREAVLNDVVNPKCLFPEQDSGGVTSACIVRSPLLQNVATNSAPSGSTLKNVAIASSFVLPGMPTLKTCGEAIVSSYSVQRSTEKLTDQSDRMRSLLQRIWGLVGELSATQLNPFSGARFGEIRRGFAMVDAASATQSLGLAKQVVDVASIDAFGKDEIIIEPLYSQVLGLVDRIVFGFANNGDYDAAEEYVSSKRETQPINAEEIFGEDDRVAERVVASLLMLHVGKLEGKTKSLSDILHDANADELLSDLFDLSEGAIDDMYEEIVETKRLSGLVVKRRPMARYVLAEGGVPVSVLDDNASSKGATDTKNVELLSALITRLDAVSAASITHYQQAVEYLTKISTTYTVIQDYESRMRTLLQNVPGMASSITHTNIPRVESEDLCEVLTDFDNSRGLTSRWTKASSTLASSINEKLDEENDAVYSSSDADESPKFFGVDPLLQQFLFSWNAEGSFVDPCDSADGLVKIGFGSTPQGVSRNAIFFRVHDPDDDVPIEDQGEVEYEGEGE